MPSCFVVGCKSGYNGAKAHLFKVPSSKLEQNWISNLPKREVKFVPHKHLVCHLHFEEKYIVSHNYIIQNNVKVNYEERKRWKLSEDAVPTRFSNEVLPIYYNKNTLRSPPTERISVTKRPKLSSNDKFKAIADKFRLPLEEWYVKRSNDSLVAYELTKTSSELMLITKSITLSRNLSVDAKIRGKPFHHLPNSKISSAADLESLIILFQKYQACSGVRGFKTTEPIRNSVQVGESIFAIDCELSTENGKMCSPCLKLRNKLRVQRSRKQTESKMSTLIYKNELLKKSNNSKTTLIRRTQKLKAGASIHLKYLQKKFIELKESDLETSIINSEVPEEMKVSMIAASKIAKAKCSAGYRYQHDWLLQCLLLKIKSNQAYRFLRDRKIIPLPHPATLQRLIRGLPCEFGFSNFVFEGLKMEFKNSPKRDKQCILMFDEIKIRESLDYDRANLQVNGFINYGEFTEEFLSSGKAKNVHADHALVFMLRTINSKLVQPIASFASRGAASGDILAKLFLSCLMKIEEAGLEVIATVCDGATTNKAFWKVFGITGKRGSIRNHIIHPCDPSEKRKLFFISDVPHIFKCIRNHMMKHRSVMYRGQFINYNYYKAVYLEEEKLTSGLKVVPKLTYSHVFPTPFQKMRVCLATQLFSNSMALGIRYYRSHGVKSLRLSEKTEEFTKEMNDLFDALNTSNMNNKLRIGDSSYMCMKNFLIMLNGEEMNTFASEVTTESLRVTLSSVLEIVEYLVVDCTFDYVLTAKFNQDCVERFFGVLRQIGGDEDHPTATTFLQLYRLMSIYFPTARLIRANVSDAIEGSPCSQHYNNFMKNRSKKLQELKEKNTEIESQILRKVLITDVAELQQGSHFPRTSDHVIYNLCGYLVFKCAKFSPCLDCISTMKENTIDGDSESHLSLLTDLQDRGNLKRPSISLVNFVQNYLEPTLHKVVSKSNTVFGFEDIVYNLPSCMKCSLGCSQDGHKESLIAAVVNFYISVRLFFFCKAKNKENLRPKSTNQKRKSAKLT